jgi:hypothetical protein
VDCRGAGVCVSVSGPVHVSVPVPGSDSGSEYGSGPGVVLILGRLLRRFKRASRIGPGWTFHLDSALIEHCAPHS